MAPGRRASRSSSRAIVAREGVPALDVATEPASGTCSVRSLSVDMLETTPSQAATTAPPDATSTTLLQLTPDAVASILLLLPLHDVCAIACTCTRLRDAALDDTRLWLPLCISRWGARTILTAWMAPTQPHPLQRRPSSAMPQASPALNATPPHPPTHRRAWLSPSPAAGSSFTSATGAASSYEPPPGWGGSPPSGRLLSSEGMLRPQPASATPIPGAAVCLSPAGSLGSGTNRPRSYRTLYRLLLTMEGMAGTWRGVGKDCNGTLYHIGWRDGHMEGVQLMCNTSQLEPLPRCSLFRLGPSHPNVVAHVVGQTHCVVKEYSSAGPRPLSAAAEAAAAVAAGGALASGSGRSGAGGSGAGSLTSGQGGLLGSSPPSSFSHELAYFMQSSVAGTRGSLKRSGSRGLRGGGAGLAGTSPPASGLVWQPPGGSSGGGGAVQGPSGVPACVHTWVRVKQPQQTKKHPLAGLWKGLHGRHGAQVLSVQYDFQGNTARIVATKVTGDRDVPAGLDSWYVNASPLPMPLPPHEARLVSQSHQLLRRQRHNQHGLFDSDESDLSDDEEGAGQLPFALQFLGNLDDSDSDSDGDAGGGGGAAASVWDAPGNGTAGVNGGAAAGNGDGRASAGGPAPGHRPQVVACYAGKGRLGKPGGGTYWVDGRLWLYDTGNLCYCWLLDPLPDDDLAVDADDINLPAPLPNAVLVEYLRLDADTATG